MTRNEGIWCVLAIAVGLLAAVVDLHTDNIQFAVLFVFIQCAVFGFARPVHPWRWAALIALCIPLLELFNVFVRLPGPRDLGFPARLFLGPVVVFFRSTTPIALKSVPGSLLALIPAMAGVYTGAWLSSITPDRTSATAVSPRRPT